MLIAVYLPDAYSTPSGHLIRDDSASQSTAKRPVAGAKRRG
jgi:hypothetical protein